MKAKHILLCLTLLILSGLTAYAIWLAHEAKVKSELPPKIDSVKLIAHDYELPQHLDFAGERVPLEMFYIRERLERELLSNTYFHSNTILLLKRTSRWFPMMDSILALHDIPADFKYLAMIESNLTNAVSPAKAVGMWQFIPTTAKEYGLRIDKEVDMRYNEELETVAACKYLKKSYEKFGSWTLAAVAYNAGNSRVTDFLEKQKVSSYYDLLMAEETERYIFRILAIKLITENPEQYGFYISEHLHYQPYQYRTVVVTNNIDNLADFAQKEGIHYKLLKIYNPWLRSNTLKVKPGERFEIKIPIGDQALTHQELIKAND